MKIFKVVLYMLTVSLSVSLAITALTACKRENLSEYDKIHEDLMAMTAYSCNAEIKYISNSGENTYKAKLIACSDGRYKIETTEPEAVKGGIIVNDGKMLWQYNPVAKQKVALGNPDKPERTQLNIFTFLNNMVKSQDVGLESASLDESLCTVFEAKIPGGLKLFSSEKLWVDNKSHNPTKLVIYDEEEKERVVVSFDNFEYNPEIKDSIFTLD